MRVAKPGVVKPVRNTGAVEKTKLRTTARRSDTNRVGASKSTTSQQKTQDNGKQDASTKSVSPLRSKGSSSPLSLLQGSRAYSLC